MGNFFTLPVTRHTYSPDLGGPLSCCHRPHRCPISLTDCGDADDFDDVLRWRTLEGEGLDDVLGEAEADDGQLRGLYDDGRHPAVHVRDATQKWTQLDEFSKNIVTGLD